MFSSPALSSSVIKTEGCGVNLPEESDDKKLSGDASKMLDAISNHEPPLGELQ